MAIERLDREVVTALTVDALGLDADCADLETPEVLAASIRRAASFLCPISPHSLTRRVEESLGGLITEIRSDGGASMVRTMLESLVAYGDLVEAPVAKEEDSQARRMLFLAQPSYVLPSSGADPTSDSADIDGADHDDHTDASNRVCLLIGISADGLSLADDELNDRIDPYNHTRQLTLKPGEDPEELLGALGIRAMTEEQWLKNPPKRTPDAVIQEYKTRLDSAGPSGSIESVRILDPTKSVTYYRGRWREPMQRDTGAFIARLPVQFGADQWCYAELQRGSLVKLVDLPALHRSDRACDEAWRLQAALDTAADTPQVVSVCSTSEPDKTELRFHSPIPSWVQRRLDAFGQPLGKRSGCLFAYTLPDYLVDQELKFLQESIWVEPREHAD